MQTVQNLQMRPRVMSSPDEGTKALWVPSLEQKGDRGQRAPLPTLLGYMTREASRQKLCPFNDHMGTLRKNKRPADDDILVKRDHRRTYSSTPFHTSIDYLCRDEDSASEHSGATEHPEHDHSTPTF